MRPSRIRTTCSLSFSIASTCVVVGCATLPTSQPTRQTSGPVRLRASNGIQAIPVILPPLIDGRLNEGIWNDSPAYGQFVVPGPKMRRARRPTEVRVAYEAANLYIAVKCLTDTSIGPPKVRHWLDDDRGVTEDESCRVLLWTDPDRPEVYYDLAVNPQGVLYDARRHMGFPLGFSGWDGPTQAAATVTQGAWQAELRVPLRRVGVPDRPWAINVIRHDALAGERSVLSAGECAWPSVAAEDKSGSNARVLPASRLEDEPVPTRFRTLLTWPMPARPLTTGPLPVRRLRLADMERDVEPLSSHHATIAASEQYATHGRRSLRIRFAKAGGNVRLSVPEADWSNFETLRLDVAHQDPTGVPVAVRLTDTTGQARTTWLRAAKGDNAVALPLAVVAAGLRVDSMQSVALLCGRAATVWVDHIRLEEETLSYHENPHRPARGSRSTLEVEIDADVWTAVPAPVPVAVDVTAPLYATKKVLRLSARSVGTPASYTFESSRFRGHDRRDPVRVAACLVGEDAIYLATHRIPLRADRERVVFRRDDFCFPRSTLPADARPSR